MNKSSLLKRSPLMPKPSPLWRHRRIFFALGTVAAAVAAFVILEARR